MNLEKTFFKVLFFVALYLFAFGFTCELYNLFAESPNEYQLHVARIIGVIFATFMIATGEFSMTNTKDAPNPYIIDDDFVSNENLSVVFNHDTFNKWIRIHFPEEYKGKGEHYVTHMRLEELAYKYYENFTFIDNGNVFAVQEGRLHSQFIFDIKHSWMMTSNRTV